MSWRIKRRRPSVSVENNLIILFRVSCQLKPVTQKGGEAICRLMTLTITSSEADSSPARYAPVDFHAIDLVTKEARQ